MSSSGKNIEVTEGLRTAVEEKFGKLSRYFTEDTEIHVTFSVEKELQKIEVTIPTNSFTLRNEVYDDDLYAAIDNVVDKLERQIRKNKDKINKYNGMIDYLTIIVYHDNDIQNHSKYLTT